VKKIYFFVVVAAVAAVFISGCAQKRNIPKDIDGAKLEAISSAWLSKLDNGWFQQCYDETSQKLKDGLDKNQWLNNMITYRKPLGTADKRQEINMIYEPEIANVGKGDFVIIQYAAIYQQKLAVIEAVTLIKEEDGSWKVSGYWIK
jgi:hypothetical protein